MLTPSSFIPAKLLRAMKTWGLSIHFIYHWEICTGEAVNCYASTDLSAAGGTRHRTIH
jgi:hypothetical protein